MSGDEAGQRQRHDDSGWINLRRPIDFNTILTLIVFLGGGLLFISETRANLDSLKDQVKDLGTSTSNRIDRLERRFDSYLFGDRRVPGVLP